MVSLADPRFACLKKGLFLCQDCAQVHTSFGPTVSRTKSLNFGNWNDETLQVTLQLICNHRFTSNHYWHLRDLTLKKHCFKILDSIIEWNWAAVNDVAFCQNEIALKRKCHLICSNSLRLLWIASRTSQLWTWLIQICLSLSDISQSYKHVDYEIKCNVTVKKARFSISFHFLVS